MRDQYPFVLTQSQLIPLSILRWWEMFNDDVLDTFIKRALENNRDVMVAAARVDAARANLGYTKADQWPSFGFNVGANTGNSLGGMATLR